jgi:uncharacterized protein YjbJ (UPF0337 family)
LVLRALVRCGGRRQLSTRLSSTGGWIHYQESIMNKDQVEGRIEEAKGKVKEVTGKVVGNKDLEVKGKVQKTVGEVQAGYGDLKEDVKKGI